MINGTVYAWGDVSVNIMGVHMTGIRKIEYSDTQQVENIYGAGSMPVGRGYGRYEATVKLTLLMDEARTIGQSVPTHRLQDIAPFDVVVSYIPAETDRIHTDVVKNCQFKNNVRSWTEGDTSKEVELELICSHIAWG